MKSVVMSSFVIIPENIVYSAWEAVDKDENSGFAVVLQAAEEYKAADMTPLFLFDKDSMHIYCFASETFGKKLH